MDWSVKDILAIQLNSYVYFHKENSKIESYINLSDSDIENNFLHDMRFDFTGDNLILAEASNFISLYDMSKI